MMTRCAGMVVEWTAESMMDAQEMSFGMLT